MPPSERKVEAVELEHRALALRTVGWMLLIFDAAIISVFIFVGLRSGSLLWLYWTLIQGVLGMLLVAAGRRSEELAGEITGDEAEPHTRAGNTGEKAA